MTVRLDINANVTGQGQVNRLNRGVQQLGRNSAAAATQFGTLEGAAARGRASFQSLATTLNVGLVAGFAAVGFGINRFVRDTFAAGNLIEGLEIRFQLLFGSVEEGARAFDTLNEFASRVPFSLEDIAQASGNLAVVSDDADDLANVLEITGNVAAATGLDFRQTAEQIQRAFAGGIAAADVFRERGVRAMLGFQAGATISVDETVQRFNEVFGPGGEFGRATGLLAETLQGQVSLVQDAYFQFRRVVSEQFFDFLTDRIRNLVGDFQTNSERLEALATQAGNAIRGVLEGLEEGARFVIRNWETITNVFQGFIALRIAAFIQGITAALITMNVALAANPIGVLIAAVSAGIATVVVFREELGQIAGILDRIVRSGGSLNEQAAAAEARAGVEADIARSVQAAADARQRDLDIQRDGNAFINSRVAEREAELAERRLQATMTQAAIDERISTRNIANAQNLRQSVENVNVIERERISLLLERDSIVGNLTDSERSILEIKREILDFEMRTGEVVAQTAEQIFRQRQEQEALRDVVAENLNDYEGITEAVDTTIDRQQRLNRFLTEHANTTRRAFQETVRLAEATQRASEFAEAANNREQGSLAGRDPQITQERIEQILQQEMAWESVLETVDDIARTVTDDLFDSIRDGENVFDSLRNSALRALDDIARQVASSALADIFGRGVQAAGGGGGQGVLNTVLGGARRIFGFNQGGIVPGGAPYTDRVPALLTPGERVIPRDEVNNARGMTSNVTNINISGNVDQRSIDQIRSVISTSPSQVGGANRQFDRNAAGLRNRRT